MSGKRQVRKQKTQKRILKLAITQEIKRLKEEEETMLAKYDYAITKITGYPVLVLYFLILVVLVLIEKSLLAVIFAISGFFVFGFLLLLHHENRIGKDEFPEAEDYFLAKRIMNNIFGFGTCYLGIAVLSVLYFHDYH